MARSVSASSAVLYDLRRLGTEPPRAPFYAVLGHPVAHSKSPAMQQAALDALAIDARYVALDVAPEELAAALDLLPRLGARGCNVTVPHKLAAYGWCGEKGRLDASASAAGAVNTLVWNEGGPVGHSTDGLGWEQAVRETFGLALDGARLLILGVGGAGQAVAFHALAAGSRVTVANRSPEKSALLAAAAWDTGKGEIARIAWEAKAVAEAIAASDLIVNATSLGLGATAFPFGPEVFAAGKSYYDLVYADQPTPFLQAASTAGGHTADGLSMLLHQGHLAFRLWHPDLAPQDAARALAAMRHALSPS